MFCNFIGFIPKFISDQTEISINFIQKKNNFNFTRKLKIKVEEALHVSVIEKKIGNGNASVVHLVSFKDNRN